MKKIGLIILGMISFLGVSVCFATSWYIQLHEFLYRTPRPIIPVPSNSSSCEEGEILESLFNLFQENGLFLSHYYTNPWMGDNVSLLQDYAKKNQDINYLKKAIFPYVDDKLIKKGDSVSLYCTGSDFIYQAGVFDITGTIIVKDMEDSYNIIDGEIKEERVMNYKEIYISVDEVNDETVRDLPYFEGNKLLIGCEDETRNRLLWNGGLGNDTMYPRIYRYVGGYFGNPIHSEQELIQYEGKKINIRFYLVPGYIKKDYKLGAKCENIWMLTLNVNSDI